MRNKLLFILLASYAISYAQPKSYFDDTTRISYTKNFKYLYLMYINPAAVTETNLQHYKALGSSDLRTVVVQSHATIFKKLDDGIAHLRDEIKKSFDTHSTCLLVKDRKNVFIINTDGNGDPSHRMCYAVALWDEKNKKWNIDAGVYLTETLMLTQGDFLWYPSY